MRLAPTGSTEHEVLEVLQLGQEFEGKIAHHEVICLSNMVQKRKSCHHYSLKSSKQFTELLKPSNLTGCFNFKVLRWLQQIHTLFTGVELQLILCS